MVVTISLDRVMDRMETNKVKVLIHSLVRMVIVVDNLETREINLDKEDLKMDSKVISLDRVVLRIKVDSKETREINLVMEAVHRDSKAKETNNKAKDRDKIKVSNLINRMVVKMVLSLISRMDNKAKPRISKVDKGRDKCQTSLHLERFLVENMQRKCINIEALLQ
jgi:hypothetical protein